MKGEYQGRQLSENDVTLPVFSNAYHITAINSFIAIVDLQTKGYRYFFSGSVLGSRRTPLMPPFVQHFNKDSGESYSLKNKTNRNSYLLFIT